MEFGEFLIWTAIIIIGIPIALIVLGAVVWGIVKILVALAVMAGTIIALVAVAYVVFFLLEQFGFLPAGTISEGIREVLQELQNAKPL